MAKHIKVDTDFRQYGPHITQNRLLLISPGLAILCTKYIQSGSRQAKVNAAKCPGGSYEGKRMGDRAMEVWHQHFKERCGKLCSSQQVSPAKIVSVALPLAVTCVSFPGNTRCDYDPPHCFTSQGERKSKPRTLGHCLLLSPYTSETSGFSNGGNGLLRGSTCLFGDQPPNQEPRKGYHTNFQHFGMPRFLDYHSKTRVQHG